MKRLIFITENVNKYKELLNYLQSRENSENSGISLEVVKPDTEINEIQSLNREEIVIHKLYEAMRVCHNLLTIKQEGEKEEETWILVEDTSLCISKQGGFPGPFIKFFLQSLSLENIGNQNWGSEAQSYVNFAIGRVTHNQHGYNGFSVVKNFDGVINGYIVNPRGTNGFGFDPIFRPSNSNKTNAELTLEEKAVYNPRILAFHKVLDYLENI